MPDNNIPEGSQDPSGDFYANVPPDIMAQGTGPFYSVPQKSDPPKDPQDLPKDTGVTGSFDPRFVNKMEGLLYVGFLEKTFKFAHHDITIRTASSDDMLRVGLLTKIYSETMAGVRAMTLSTVAACLVKVDGLSLPGSLLVDGDDIEARFNWVKRLHSAVVDGIYNEYLLLEQEVTEAINEMGKAGAPPMALSIPGS